MTQKKIKNYNVTRLLYKVTIYHVQQVELGQHGPWRTCQLERQNTSMQRRPLSRRYDAAERIEMTRRRLLLRLLAPFCRKLCDQYLVKIARASLYKFGGPKTLSLDEPYAQR